MQRTPSQTPEPQSAAPATVKFSIRDHLQVQRQIEQRAFQRWQCRGRRNRDAIEDWVAAERETLAEFVKARMAGARPPPGAPRTVPAVPEIIFRRQPPPHRRPGCQTKHQSPGTTEDQRRQT